MTLISHTHRFIFLKTKKTASTSVEMFFEPFCLPEGMEAGPEYRDEFIGPTGIVGSRRGQKKRKNATWPQHMRASSVLRKAGISVFARYFKFVTVRDPFTRTLSAFRYTFRKDEAFLAQSFDAQRDAFNTWLEENYAWVQDRQMYTIGPLRVANDYIRYEHMEKDIQRICARLNLPCDLERLPRTKVMPKPEHAPIDYYSPANRDRIAKTYAWEIRKFGYAPRKGQG